MRLITKSSVSREYQQKYVTQYDCLELWLFAINVSRWASFGGILTLWEISLEAEVCV